MIGGKLVKIFRDMPSLRRFVFENKTSGYAVLPWKEDNSLYSGTVLYDDGVSVGAMVEEVISRRITKGSEALRSIYNAENKGLIKVGEVYEAEVKDILTENPDAVISEPVVLGVLSGDLDPIKVRKFINVNNEIHILTKKKMWQMYLSTRGVEGAILYNDRNLVRGDEAMAELLREIPNILKEGTIEIVTSGQSRSIIEDGRVVKFKTSFRDILDLFEIKQELGSIRD